MDLTFMQKAYRVSSPVASVYINVSRDSADAEHAVGLRWREARSELRSQGADEDTLRALDGVVGRSDGGSGAQGQVAFAGGGEVGFDALVAAPPQDYAVRVGPLPDPLPYLRNRGRRVPHVAVLADSIGADLVSVAASGARRTDRVEGGDHPTHKVPGGGWKHKQMQRAVEEQVLKNARQVASAVHERAQRDGAEVVVVAGEPGVVRDLVDHLPEGTRARTVEAEAGSRASGSDNAAFERELDRVLEEHADEGRRRVVDGFLEGRGTADRVTEGLEAVVATLQRGQVDTLLWSAGADLRGERLWSDPEGARIALTERELLDLGAEEALEEDAAPVLVRAAAQTNAELVFVPEDKVRLEGGVGALLRFSDPSLPT
ncbi:Vms1/Ankzf1 family peptidyl-tRNA hydrolase [Streptomonospora nanhaiensis]|uniref:baeRF2 domain-containing protein n=1 Tax=Streptomonospora nanhaiensis TaxID=1323731 RepID=UPI001C998BAB|nr:Vms1/Ankzf1 family peptidyl-tRNA hydrolase [Streptomonospora nanhaiensis]MBX9389829.1 hypothetical protein [Streptomonospora nanhaiensis]